MVICFKISEWFEDRKAERWRENPELEEAKEKEHKSKPWYKKLSGWIIFFFILFLFYTFFIKDSRVYKPGMYDGKYDTQIWVD